MTFGCCHLESGQGNGLDVHRRKQLEKVIKNCYVNERGTNMQKYKWESHDVKVFFGDLNFRYVTDIELEEEKISKLIQQGDIMSLIQYDEFINFLKLPKNQKGLLRNYKEGTITFTPTYKYHLQSNDFDWKRVPAYTDRILYESVHELPQKNPAMNIYYGKADYSLSDHKPITSLFEAKIKVVDEKVKQRIIEKARYFYRGDLVKTQAEKKESFLTHLKSKMSNKQSSEFEISNLQVTSMASDYFNSATKSDEPRKSTLTSISNGFKAMTGKKQRKSTLLDQIDSLDLSQKNYLEFGDFDFGAVD
jgi:hypothetical protein